VLGLTFLQQAQQRQTMTLSLLQQRFRVPPLCSTLTDPVIPQHLLASYDHLLPGAALSGGGSGPTATDQTAVTRPLSQPLATALPTG